MKLLLLTSRTGGGHDMRASAFEAWAAHPQAASLGIETARMQVLEETDGLYNFGVELYNVIQRRAPWAHHLYFNLLEWLEMHREPAAIRGRAAFCERVQAVKPDVVVSTHAHLNHGFFELIRQALGRERVRCLTYCGELYGHYGFSKHWVNPASDGFIGAVEETCRQAARLGVSSGRNKLGGFMLKPAFYEPATESRAALRDAFDLDQLRFTVLLATGANGANNHLPMIRALERSGIEGLQVVALCGRDEAAREAILALAPALRRLRVVALPYIGDMHRLMRAADLIVARAGTGTTSESILTGTPILFNGLGGVMPQEWITIKFARRRGFGSILHQASALPAMLRPYLRPDHLAAERRAMEAARPSRHPTDILKHLCELKP